MSYDELKRRVFEIACMMASKGAGYGQERVVLQAVEEEVGAELRKIHPEKLKRDQLVLTAWHDLFREGQLAWGYNVDNPNSPFFHVPERTIQAMN